jgi:RND family efflux transporter MFP subunit
MNSNINQITSQPERGGSRAPRVVLVTVLVAAVGLAGFVGIRMKQAVAKKGQVAADRVAAQAALTKKAPSRTVTPVGATWTPRVELTGTLKPWRDADVGFELGGRLVRVNVAVGDKVGEGAALAVLDTSRSLAEVSAAEAQARAAAASLALAQDHLKRTEALVLTRSIPDAQAEQARQQVALARAQLEGAEATARLARTGAGLHTISAPFRGIVTRAPTSAGSVAQPGAPLVHMEDTSRLRLSASLGEDEVPLVAVGAPVSVTYRDRTVTGKVVTLVPSLDQATRRAPLEVEVPNDTTEPLLAWSFVRATIAGKGEMGVLRLPSTARRPGSQDEVFKVEGHKLRVLHLAHAVADDGAWLVTSGLQPGDAILDAPDSDMRDGDEVELSVK